MRILSASVTNFASYKELAFNFKTQGLTLISGPTGSGKSTLCDVTPWVLFGRTSKGGAVDEIRSWNSKEPTTGALELELGDGSEMTVVRTRGVPKENDLYYQYLAAPGSIIRGKDLNQTQEMLNNALGFDLELYLSGAYIHEFSQSMSFFTSPAKIRRQVIEQVVDLNLATALTEAAVKRRKKLKESFEENKMQLILLKDRLKNQEKQLEVDQYKYDTWELIAANKLKELEDRHNNFKRNQDLVIKKLFSQKLRKQSDLQDYFNDLSGLLTDRHYEDEIIAVTNQIEALGTEVCPSCRSKLHSDDRILLAKKKYDLERQYQLSQQSRSGLSSLAESMEKQINDLDDQIKIEGARQNTFKIQIDELKLSTNPYTVPKDEVELLKKQIDFFQDSSNTYAVELSDFDFLSAIVDTLRIELVQSAIQETEAYTNQLLTDYFDGELRVIMSAGATDKIEVEIFKDSNLCVYTQLSKGQRQMLRLCFSLSVMNLVGNRHAIHFPTVCLDEALDGLSDELKVKAYDLLQHVATKRESVFVVDHCEALKAMFDNRVEVQLVDGASEIT